MYDARRLADRNLERLEAGDDWNVHCIRRRESTIQKRPAWEAVSRFDQMSSTRSMLALSASVSGGVAKRAPRCIGQVWRNGMKPGMHFVGD